MVIPNCGTVIGNNCCTSDPRLLEGPKSADVGIRTPKDKGAFMTYVSDIFKSKPSPMSGRIDSPKVRLSLLQSILLVRMILMGSKFWKQNYECNSSLVN